jgi:hypothetical protein
VSFVASDASVSNTATRNVSVAAVNDAPVNSVPAAQTTAQNTTKVFSTGNGNLVSISDVDAASAAVRVQLVATSGTTTLSGTTGLSFTVGDGTNDASMTFTGTVTALNTALAGLSFIPTTNFVGSANLQIITSDQGNTGTGGTLTDTDNVTVTVTGTSYSATILATSGLVNYWRFGETVGTTTAADSEPTSPANATLSGTTLGVAGRSAGDSNTAVQFNGTTAYGTATRQISTDFSIELWFKSNGGGVTSDPVVKWNAGAGLVDANTSGTNDDFGISLRADGTIVAGIGGGSPMVEAAGDLSINSAAGYDDNAWHQVVFTRSATTGQFKLYVDGALKATNTSDNTNALSDTASLNFGRLASNSNYYTGALDEVATYNTVLGAATITAHYNAGL